MPGRNITLTLPPELVRRAKVLAATRDISVSALVAELLETASRDERYEEEWREERRLMNEGLPMRVGEVTWTRTDVHER